MAKEETKAAALWREILEELKAILTEVTVLRYFGGTEGLALQDDALEVALPDDKDAAQLEPFEAFVSAALAKYGIASGSLSIMKYE